MRLAWLGAREVMQRFLVKADQRLVRLLSIHPFLHWLEMTEAVETATKSSHSSTSLSRGSTKLWAMLRYKKKWQG